MAGITRTTRLGLFALGFLAATGVEAVRADEAYLCEGGRIVKVTPGTLETLKRTDACIAGYFGLKIDAAGVRDNGVRDIGALETGAIAVPAAIPAAEKRPAPALKAAERLPAKTAAVKEPAAAPRASAGTDYRNVVLLNATPGTPAVFRHDR